MIKSIVCSLLFLLLNFSLQAQDSTKTEVHDVLCLEKGGLIKGEILSFDKIGGGIVFKDLNGKVYSLAREEYQYFIEDKIFVAKEKGPKVLHPRKESEWEVHLGMSAAYLNLSHDFTVDDYYLNGVTSQANIPLCFKAGAGKYLNSSNYLGLTAEFAFASENTRYYQAGLRYKHQYDGGKSNVGLYVPVELCYQHQDIKSNFGVNDTLFTGQGFEFPTYKDLSTSVHAVSLSAGHGFAFMLANNKSVSVELMALSHLFLSQSWINLEGKAPVSRFRTSGVKMAVVFNL
ncbi:MAG: hypothetical protein NWR72_01395 [Bacteroidia bacterium]|nr:hypothetical protein [Bacteroidia bacterium]